MYTDINKKMRVAELLYIYLWRERERDLYILEFEINFRVGMRYTALLFFLYIWL